MKKTDDARFTLGMIGAAPARKRLDLAVDLLERLLQSDREYCLRVKGRNPLDYSWLLNRPEEQDYYREVVERINSHSLLATRVILDPPGNDVNDWLSMVGFVLSPSDFESFHMAIGEGLLAGCRPVVWPWDGATEIWGDEYVVDGLDGAYEAVRAGLNAPLKLPEHLNPEGIVEAWSRRLLARP